MVTTLMLAAGLAGAVQGDTVRLTAAQALERAVAEGRSVRAAAARERAAAAMLGQARAWRNPILSVTAENLGAEREVTGRTGLAGTEGQATLHTTLTVGGDRGAAIRTAEAARRGAAAGRELSEAALRAELVDWVARADRDATLARHAAEEASDLDRFARAIALRARQGRSSGGEAARAALEATLAATNAARRAAEAAASEAQVTRLLGLPPGTPVRIETPVCGTAVGAEPSPPPELRLARAQADSAAAAVALARARAIPDLQPIAGLRRTAGFSGLLLGLSIEVPVANPGRHLIAAARADSEAVAAELDGLERRLAAERAGAGAALSIVEAAGARFTPEWLDAVQRTLVSALARYEAGEGTLAELFDARRARLAALDDFARWRAERRMARTQLARLAGNAIGPELLCDDRTMEVFR